MKESGELRPIKSVGPKGGERYYGAKRVLRCPECGYKTIKGQRTLGRIALRRRKTSYDKGRTYERSVFLRLGQTGKLLGGPSRPGITEPKGPLSVLGKTHIDAKTHKAGLSKQKLKESIRARHRVIESKCAYQNEVFRYAHHYRPEVKLRYRGRHVRWCLLCEHSFYLEEAPFSKCPRWCRLLGWLRLAGIV